MPVTKIQLKPGLVRDNTSYANEGGWYYADKIRFRSGSPEKIGGWVKAANTTYLGTCTALLPWAALDGSAYAAVGTNLKYYIEWGSDLYDITPYRKTTNPLANNPITTVSGSATITIADTAHGAQLGDYVHISGASTTNGIPAAEINAQHTVTQVVNANSYKVACTTTATSSSTGGGAAVVVSYELNVGLAFYVAGNGFGAGTWGSGIWGGAITPTVSGQMKVWSQDTFGEDLIFSDRGGALYYWDTSVGTGNRAVLLSSMVGASDVPTIVSGVLVAESRYVIALGANPLGVAAQDPLMVRWSDVENAVDWTPTVINTAGGQRLSQGSTIITAKKTRQEILIWTDTAVYSMQFIGGDLVFGFNLLSASSAIAGPYAVGVVNATAYWLGLHTFYVYDGTVNVLPCPMRNFVFGDMNIEQRFQFFAGVNREFNEVTWFYCSADSNVIDRYITYNYAENIWYPGTISRSAWYDASVRNYPLAADSVNNVLLYHESGVDDVSTGTAVAITAYIESSDFDLGDGDQFMFIRRVIPDVSFVGSTAASPAVTFTIKTRNTPGNDWISSSNEPSSSAITRTAVSANVFTSPIEQYTPQLYVRLRGRQAVIRLESSAVGVQWQLGAPRLDVRPDGHR